MVSLTQEAQSSQAPPRVLGNSDRKSHPGFVVQKTHVTKIEVQKTHRFEVRFLTGDLDLPVSWKRAGAPVSPWQAPLERGPFPRMRTPGIPNKETPRLRLTGGRETIECLWNSRKCDGWGTERGRKHSTHARTHTRYFSVLKVFRTPFRTLLLDLGEPRQTLTKSAETEN